MSILDGRLAGKEGAYFFQDSKQAAGRLVEKKAAKNLPSSSASSVIDETSQADVLPEVLRHSLPKKIFQQQPAESPIDTGSKWSYSKGGCGGGEVSHASREALNPLRAYVSLPPVTFGPKRWELPKAGNAVLHSTANDLRRDRYPAMSPEKMKATAEGLAQVGMGFVAATAIVFGGGTMFFGWVASKLDMRTSDDVRTKGTDIVQKKFENFGEQLTPLRNWVEDTRKRWHFKKEQSNIEDKSMIKELSKVLGTKSAS